MQSGISGYFLCPKAHQLSWTKTYIYTCGLCGPVNSMMSRFKCSSCNQFFCTNCVIPPLLGDYCGAGHNMKYIPSLQYHSCDVCRKSINGKGAYRCQQCDYDVCDDCRIEKED